MMGSDMAAKGRAVATGAGRWSDCAGFELSRQDSREYDSNIYQEARINRQTNLTAETRVFVK